ncbi:MAG: ribonuclease HI family protein [Candidatus Omnitrophica bacterium]|nr:ribonuclease HI family protein [Candidatus Omnitrophota bacterium]
MITIYTDGSSAGNPGRVGIGYLLYKGKTLIKEEGIYLGIQTNNFAEYMALIFSLEEALSMGEKQVSVFSDSKLLCEQINGNFKVKDNNIFPLFVLAKKLISSFEAFTITHIEREKNKEADALAQNASGFLR